MNNKVIYACISISITTAILLSSITIAEGKFQIINDNLITLYKLQDIIIVFVTLFDYIKSQELLSIGGSSVRQRRDVRDDFNNARKDIENEIGIDDVCVVDGDCTGNPVVECIHENSVLGQMVGKCQFTWWFILILVLIAVVIIGGILSCLCSPCCCLYECMRKLCCCCC